MKCTACGADMKGRGVCEECGNKAEGMPDKLEVEYKDFKISELLEIRPKYGHVRGAAEEPDYGGFDKADDLSGVPQRKKTLSRIIPIIAVLALAAGVVYLFYHILLR